MQLLVSKLSGGLNGSGFWPHEYQFASRDFLLEQLYRDTGAGLWQDPGMGKTIITLLAIELLKLDGIERTLVLAPRRVVPGWLEECEKWGLGLKVVLVRGNEKQRFAALAEPADVYVATRDSCTWFKEIYPTWKPPRPKKVSDDTKHKANLAEWHKLNARPRFKWQFDLCVIDEITSFKSWSAKRTKSLRSMLQLIPKAIGLTGTPFSNSLGDIFSQHFMLDRGKTLGSVIERFRDIYMTKGGHENREWIFIDSKRAELEKRIAPYYLRQSALDHLDLPARVENVIKIELPPAAKKLYDSMKNDMHAEIDDATSLTALSAGGKYNLCRQMASGSAYDELREVVSIHDAKIEALQDLLDELNGKPLLVAYCYTHEMHKIKKAFPKCSVVNGDTTDKEFAQIKADWKAGKIQMLVTQCQSMSHGVDGLQSVSQDVCWYTLTDQPETRTQLETRVWRQGNKAEQVRFHYLIAIGTVEVAIKRGLDQKDANQASVLQSIKDYRNGV